jgi:phospholipid/cholesterol/gamma-HCH transport system substrate-binding protein
MMAERKADIIVGLVVFIALLILILSLMWGKDVKITYKMVNLVVRFEDVRGLEKGDPVVVRGTDQGTVESVRLGSGYTEVRLLVREDIDLYSDVQVNIESRELLGGKQVVIYPGSSGDFFDLNRVIYGELSGDMGMVLARVDNLLLKADSVLVQFGSLIQQKPWSKVLNNIEETTGEVKGILRENRSGLQSTVNSLEEIVRTVKEDSTAERLGRVVVELDSTIDIIKMMVLRIEKEEGTVAKLIQDRELYDQIMKTFTDLDSLVADIKANPKRYIHVSLF